MAHMTTWTMEQAKRDFSNGYMENFSLERAPMQPGWHVMLKAGTRRGPLIDAREKQPRLFKTLDAAVSAIETVGFRVEYLGH